MLRDSLPIHVERRGKRDRSTNIFPTGLLNHDGSRRKGELLTKAGAHIHKVGGSGFYTEKIVNILSFINTSINVFYSIPEYPYRKSDAITRIRLKIIKKKSLEDIWNTDY